MFSKGNAGDIFSRVLSSNSCRLMTYCVGGSTNKFIFCLNNVCCTTNILWNSYCLSSLNVLCAESLSRVRLCATLWTIACQAPLSMGFSRQEYWSGLPFPSPGYLPNPEIEIASLMSPGLAGRFFTTIITWEAPTVF